MVERFDAPDPAAAAALLKEHASRWSRTVFVFPPPDLTYGRLNAWLTPALAVCPRAFVFPVEPAGPATVPTETP